MGGCGGASTSTDSARPGIGRGSVLVAALGDSITAGSPLWDPSPATRAAIGPAVNPRSQYEYWAAQADPRLRFRNCGVFGERTDQIVQRLYGCAAGAGALIVQGGINDIAQALQAGPGAERRAVAAAARNLDAMVRRGKRLGIPVAITDVLPWNNGHPQADAAIAALNRRIAAIAHRERVRLLPFHNTLEDPRNPGEMRPDWTIDGDHPSVAGYALLGRRAVAPALRALR